jgi:hypothetical protein
MLGNTGSPSLATSTFNLLGPNVASFTAYGLQFPSTAPSGGQVLSFPTPTSGISTGTWLTPSSLYPPIVVSFAGLTTSSDYCATINTAVQANPTATIDARGTPTKVYCNTSMISVPANSSGSAATFTGTLLLGNTVFFVNSASGFQSVPSGVVVHGGGRTAGTNYVAGTGTDFEICNATNTVSGDYTTYCASTAYSATISTDTNNYPAVIALSNYSSADGVANNATSSPAGTGFGARVDGVDVGCSMTANVTAYAMWQEQEQSQLQNFRWHNCTAAGDIGLDWGGGLGGAQNSWASDFQGSTAAGYTNAASAVGIRIWTGGGTNGNPPIIQKGSIVDNATAGTLPAYCIQYASGIDAGMLLQGVHTENCTNGLGLSKVTIKGTLTAESSNGLHVDTFDCGSSGTTNCIDIISTLSANNFFSNIRSVNVNITNTILDPNNTNITQLAFPYVGEYITGVNGQVIIDTTGTNLQNSGATEFVASGIKLLGSSTGTTTFTSANSSATNYTVTIPAATGTLTETIASGTVTLGTSAIASGACATAVTVSASGVASTDAITWTPNASIKAVTGYAPSTSGGLSIAMYPTANNVTADVCNWSSGSITPGAVVLNFRVVR